MKAEQVARGLGVFSVGLGLAELLAPKWIGGLLGMEHRTGLLRLYGLREIGAGVSILARPDPGPGLWARVGGDALDLAALGAELANGNPKKGRVAVATGVIASITALDAVTARKLASADKQQAGAAPAAAKTVERTLTIGKSPDELYRLWREPQTLPRILGGAAQVTATDATHAHWKVAAPLGRTLEWDTEIVEERPGELVRWESLPGASLPNQGSISFRPAPDGWGTEAMLRFRFEPPPGPLGEVAALLPDAVPATAIGTALRHFKSLAETGEIPTLERNPSARGRGDTV